MAREFRVLPAADDATPKQVRIVTIGMLVWAALWAGLATWVAMDIGQLRQISSEEMRLAGSLSAIANQLAVLRHLPFVGVYVNTGVLDLSSAAAVMRLDGSASGAGIDELSLLLGLAISIVPVIPFAVLFFRLRATRRREAVAISAALRDPLRRHLAVRYLADRAMTNLPYRELLERAAATNEPAPGDEETLAKAELDRLRLVRRAGR